MEQVPVTVVVVTHNSASHLSPTLRALLDDPRGPAEILVVDNASTDESLRIAERHGVRSISFDHNQGFGAGCNAGAGAATQPLVAFINPDVHPSPGWLPPLVEVLREPGVGAVMPTIELADRPGHFNTSGGALTYVGLSWATDSGRPIPPEEHPVEVPFPSGAAFLISRDIFQALGGFREDFFMYVEDADLGWRLLLRDLRTLRVPRSRVSHDYHFLRNPGKLFYLERNRLRMLAANYRWDTLVALLPALLLTELGVAVVAARDGWLPAKLRSWGALLSQPGLLRRTHRQVQRGRLVGDAAVLRSLGADLGRMGQVRPPPGVGLAGGLLRAYRGAVLPYVSWSDRRAITSRPPPGSPATLPGER